jgi:hypothetical protein
MPRGSTPATVQAMNADHGEEIVLHLDPGEPIRGRITFATGPALSFHGWLDLASKLEHVLSQAGGTTIATPPRPRLNGDEERP